MVSKKYGDCQSFFQISKKQEQWLAGIIDGGTTDEVKEYMKEKERAGTEERIKFAEKTIRMAENQADIPGKEEAERRMKQYNDIVNEGGEGYVPYIVSREEYKEALKLVGRPPKEPSNEKSEKVDLTAYESLGRECQILFTENGWEVLKDTRKNNLGYLHITDDSPDGVTEKVCETLTRYFFQHDHELPGLGATPQSKYLSGYSLEDMERIGNDGKKGYYA